MEFTLDAALFREAFSIAGRAVAAKSGRSVLQSVKVIASGETLTLVGSDLDQTISHKINSATITSEGIALLPKSKFDEILRTTSSEAISVQEIAKGKLIVTAGKARWTMNTEDPDTFPETRPQIKDGWFTVTGPDFEKLVNRTIYAADYSKVIRATNGVLMETEITDLGSAIEFAATDGRRLSYQKVEAKFSKEEQEPEDDSNFEYSVIIPTETLRTALAINKSKDSINIGTNGSSDIWFSFGNTVYSSRLTEGIFPNWRMFKINPVHKFNIKVDEFEKSIDQASIMRSADTNAIKVVFSDGLCEMSGEETSGDSKVETESEWKWEAMEFRIWPNNILDILRSIDQEKIECEIENENQPIVFRADGFYSINMTMSKQEVEKTEPKKKKEKKEKVDATS